MSLFDYLFGFRKIRVDSTNYEGVRSILTEGRLVFHYLKIEENGCEFQLAEVYIKRFSVLFADYNYTMSDIMGFPSFLLRYKARYGILVGLLIFLGVLFCFNNFVWDIRIYGNEEMSTERVKEELGLSGFAIGARLNKIDFDELSNRLLSSSKDIAWISVNMSGVVANVEVREYKKGASGEGESPSLRNIVASQDGQVAVVSIRSGKKMIEVGQVVRKGDLLISGIIDSQSLGVRYERADGDIFAYVNEEILVEIPLKTTEKRFTGREFKEISFNIFGKSINIFSNCRNSASSCDKISITHQVKLLGRFPVPVFVEKVVWREYFEQSKTIDVSHAVELANAEVVSELHRLLDRAELISKQISVHQMEGSVRIVCKLYCVKNIAEPIEFKIS